MPGPLKKDPSLVARRNKPPAKTVLKKPTRAVRVPSLPAGTRWFPQVREWWKQAWSSPMAGQWADADRDAVLLGAVLRQQFWDPKTSASTRNQTAAQIRAINDQLGMSPMARNRLGWEIEQPGDDSARTPAKRAVKKAAPAKESDPRKRRLHAVS